MAQNKIVVRYLDGRVLKGYTVDFLPTKDVFHVLPADAAPGAKTVAVATRQCKAIFFVKDFAGNPQYRDNQEFDPIRNVGGRKIRVAFRDDEIMIGTTQGYQFGRPGFFVFPADPLSNIDRSYVVSAATKEVSFL